MSGVTYQSSSSSSVSNLSEVGLGVSIDGRCDGEGGGVCSGVSTLSGMVRVGGFLRLCFVFFLCFLPILWSSHWVGPFSHISQSWQ